MSGMAAKAAGELYGYGHTNVLFKPTKAGGNMNMLFPCSFFLTTHFRLNDGRSLTSLGEIRATICKA